MGNDITLGGGDEIDWPRTVNYCAECGEPAVAAYDIVDVKNANDADENPEWVKAVLSDDYTVCRGMIHCFIHEA